MNSKEYEVVQTFNKTTQEMTKTLLLLAEQIDALVQQQYDFIESLEQIEVHDHE